MAMARDIKSLPDMALLKSFEVTLPPIPHDASHPVPFDSCWPFSCVNAPSAYNLTAQPRQRQSGDGSFLSLRNTLGFPPATLPPWQNMAPTGLSGGLSGGLLDLSVPAAAPAPAQRRVAALLDPAWSAWERDAAGLSCAASDPSGGTGGGSFVAPFEATLGSASPDDLLMMPVSVNIAGFSLTRGGIPEDEADDTILDDWLLGDADHPFEWLEATPIKTNV